MDGDEVAAALRAARSQALAPEQALLLAEATVDGAPLVDGTARAAAEGLAAAAGEVANGGLDQFVWNVGAGRARRVAAAFRAVGALENADALEQLAAALERYPPDADAGGVPGFLEFRRRCGGPFFPVPDLVEEVGAGLAEYLMDRPPR